MGFPGRLYYHFDATQTIFPGKALLASFFSVRVSFLSIQGNERKLRKVEWYVFHQANGLPRAY
jgi:hypothetical protein